ncbi:MAG: cytochrome c [Planctomycetaceae bacterium]|nr:cytochrome c [Planctomycetaceae bacterium]
MSVRWQSLIVGLTCALAGCGGDASQMRFVENSTLAKPVHRKARAVVTKTLDKEYFGTPLESVAWLKLPVKYGRAEGKITAIEDQTLTVELNAEATDLTGFDAAEFVGTELLLTSGANQGKSIPLVSFDGKTKTFEMSSSAVVPAVDDQFIAGGNVLKHGRKLYARHCQHCHGISGDGDGPTAKYLNPRPRDYRQGKFKFTSTAGPAGKATRDDLRRIVGQGIPGTYMPAFVPMLKDGELTAIIEYVRWLAMRGEVEWQLLGQFKDEYASDRAKKEAKESGGKESEIEKQIATQLKEFEESGLSALVQEVAGDLSDKWIAAEEEGAAIIPEVARVADSAESRKRGKDLFYGKVANCVNCHGLAAKGNGAQTEDVAKNLRTGELYPTPGLFDDWDQPVKPRDLTRGIYRGGRRPIDIYRRITQGIKGTPMPGAPKTLKSDEIWDLVNFVLSIPFESPAPKAAPAHNIAGQSGEKGHAN